MDGINPQLLGQEIIHLSVKVSRLKPTSPLLGILAYATLILYSAKTSTRTWKHQPFFALSAYSFKTAATDQKDAYTILCLSDGIANGHDAGAAAGETNEPGNFKADGRHGKEYLLWESSFI